MYATVNRRQANPETQPTTRQRASSELIPKLRQAPGFVAFYVVAGENNMNTAITIWEDRAAADAFQAEAQAWGRVLEEHGHRLESRGGGEVVLQATAQQ